MTEIPVKEPKKRRKRKRTPQARGLVRREKILAAAKELFARDLFEDVSYNDIADHAEVPAGSMYHFFPNKLSICTAIAQDFGGMYVEEMSRPFDQDGVTSWQEIVDQQIRRGAQLVEDNPAARQIIFGGKTPPEIKTADRDNDRRIGDAIEAAFNETFQLPNIPNKQEVFFVYVEIVDLIFTLSVIEHGYITEHAVEEAQRAGKAYLRCYIPDVLPLQTPSPAPQGILLREEPSSDQAN